ncbi:MAG: rhomboid family intramembrane serine protease [bacterium]|nr:rhomboid family intramembrane serine protease [bacterium]
MSLADRQYINSSSYGGGGGSFSSANKNVVFVLIAINTLVFFLIPVGSRIWLYELALSSIGIKNFKFWQFVSYMFLHANFMHIFFNMWGLYLFGMTILPVLGTARFLQLYFLSGISGAGLWMLFNWNSNAPIVGASGAVFGVLMAAAMLHPHMRIQLLFPPIPMQMKTFVMIYAAIEIFNELSSAKGGIAHLAHLGGFISAYFYLKHLYGNQVWDIFGAFHGLLPKRSPRKKKVPRDSKSKMPEGWKVYSNPKAPSIVSKEELNRLLDKISEHGMQSLTQEELETLKRASGEMKH